MPTSALQTWPRLLNLVHTVPHRAVLDVGPGHGKAAVLLREYLNDPPARIDAVEAWGPYVHDFGLHRLYDTVYEEDVTDWPRQRLAAYEVVLMADVIEHIDLGDAFELLARIPGRVVIGTPQEFFHNGDGHPPTEEHVSHWRDDVWKAVHRTVRPIEEHHREWGAHLVRLAPLP